ncbi:hypothetical protein GCM10009668_19340 [Nocardioides dubius]|uniref:Uncharacterized protein n=1 Tax=Nocardioides dubius TaxID=317019 RepID=A0ABN1TU82_9ACTN
MIAKTSGTMAAIESSEESQSTRAADSPFDSGNSSHPAIRVTTITGMLIRKTEPHQNRSSSTPPTSGPSAAPAVAPTDQMAIARARWPRSRNIERTIESVEGISVAPARPSRARAAIRVSGLGANAASAEESPNPTVPISSSLLRPIRSARLPMVISRPARTNA